MGDFKVSQYVVTMPVTCKNAEVTSVSGSATAVTLLAARNPRMGAVLHNDSSATLYIKYGSAAATTDYSYEVQPNRHWEMAYNYRYTGLITGIWTSATGSARITELLE